MTIDLVTRCFNCGAVFDAASMVARKGSRDREPQMPTNGAAMLCIECGTFNIFDDRSPNNMREPRPAERRMLRKRDDVRTVLDAWHQMRAAEQGKHH